MPSPEALIIVDLQRAFTVPPKLVAAIEEYGKRFKRRIFTRFENPQGSIFRKLMKMDSCPPGSTDTVLYIQPQKRDIVITKRGYGLSAAQVKRLKRLGVKRAVICGIDTDACVLGVMFSLFDGGIDCRAVTDLCFSTSGLQREAVKIIENQFPPPRHSRAAG
jgi:nicotinamidase-related amidase